MDDILASIRARLNEDEEQDQEPVPLELTESMLVVPPGPPADKPLAPPVQSLPVRESPGAGLLGPIAAAAAAAALGQLARTVASDRAAPVNRQGGPSIEDVVREELRPLLKEWLDRNLPSLVERLVQAEIERLMGGRAP